MLEVRNLTIGYEKRIILRDVSINVNSGEVILIKGSNGSGKSTLLKAIFNIVEWVNGQILFDNVETSCLSQQELIKLGIVYIPQENFCFENLSIEENLIIAGNNLSKNALKHKIEESLILTGLFKMKNRIPFNLSGGERKLLAFAMALIQSPKLLLFDEPIAGLSGENVIKILDLVDFTKNSNDTSYLIVEHRNISTQLLWDKVFNITHGNAVLMRNHKGR